MKTVPQAAPVSSTKDAVSEMAALAEKEALD
jgi:hypothetical protein